MTGRPGLLERLLQLRSPLFAGIDQTLLIEWLETTELRYLEGNTVVLAADQANDQTLLVISGGLVVNLEQRSATPLATIGPGEVVGECRPSAWLQPPPGCARSRPVRC